jgi:membrane-associated protease RseP (regulator of RpoE activity)
VAALADVRGAGSYVAWVLEKKAFGYQNVQLTVSLQRAATRLQRELEKLKALKPPDGQRGGAQQELARAGGEAERYAALLTEAATTAQSEGTSFGKSAQLRGQALAHLPLMTPDARALAPVQASPDFRAGLTPDRWPDAGLTADPQDFRLGAEYDGDTPPRLGAVAKGGLADSMGLRPGDRLLAVDGRPVQSVWAFKAALRGVAGRTAQIELEREGKRETKKAAVPATLSAAR